MLNDYLLQKDLFEMGNNTILIVDDDPNILELVSVNCAAQGYQVLTAATGIEAMRIVEKSLPNLIILDIMLPEMDGWKVCKLIREKYQESIKIIMLMTENLERNEIIDISILMADEYMPKPFEINDLIMTIRRLLREK
jgi:DNA-binding response OmpR family regulator